MSRNTNETYTFNKLNQPKVIHVPFFGNNDCYMEVTITEHHESHCAHLQNSFPSKAFDNSINKTDPRKGPLTKSFELPQTKAVDSNEAVNAKDFIPNNKIDELNELLMQIIHSKVKTVHENIGDLTKLFGSKAKVGPAEVAKATRSTPVDPNEPLLTNPIDKLIKQSIGGVTQHTQCSCSSTECSCANSKIAKPNTSDDPDPSKPISSPLIKKLSAADSKKRVQIFDSNFQNVTEYDDYINTPPYINDLPLEGHNNHPMMQIHEDIDEIAREIYNPEEREKKLRLLRLLIQEALPKNNVPIMNKTIEIPHVMGHDLKKADSLIIRIIVEKELKD